MVVAKVAIDFILGEGYKLMIMWLQRIMVKWLSSKKYRWWLEKIQGRKEIFTMGRQLGALLKSRSWKAALRAKNKVIYMRCNDFECAF